MRGLTFEKNEQSYLDFLVRKEHAFIRNIFDDKELASCKRIATLENYHKIMMEYFHIVKIAEQEIKCVSNYDMIFGEKLREFLTENAPVFEYDIEYLVNDIKAVEIKNNKAKSPKFTMQLYAYFYDMMADLKI